ncbi:uncharacterized protein G2W53_033968 [Senna tora]|uniref:Uncharacterized protein n=1 Tax=Senna tora TaxID=362788 RepID=A0A834W8H1_9FABA|nr:uncharacterized protein G2W53_033968 [Senna tora]
MIRHGPVILHHKITHHHHRRMRRPLEPPFEHLLIAPIPQLPDPNRPDLALLIFRSLPHFIVQSPSAHEADPPPGLCKYDNRERYLPTYYTWPCKLPFPRRTPADPILAKRRRGRKVRQHPPNLFLKRKLRKLCNIPMTTWKAHILDTATTFSINILTKGTLNKSSEPPTPVILPKPSGTTIPNTPRLTLLNGKPDPSHIMPQIRVMATRADFPTPITRPPILAPKNLAAKINQNRYPKIAPKIINDCEVGQSTNMPHDLRANNSDKTRRDTHHSLEPCSLSWKTELNEALPPQLNHHSEVDPPKRLGKRNEFTEELLNSPLGKKVQASSPLGSSSKLKSSPSSPSLDLHHICVFRSTTAMTTAPAAMAVVGRWSRMRGEKV